VSRGFEDGDFKIHGHDTQHLLESFEQKPVKQLFSLHASSFEDADLNDRVPVGTPIEIKEAIGVNVDEPVSPLFGWVLKCIHEALMNNIGHLLPDRMKAFPDAEDFDLSHGDMRL